MAKESFLRGAVILALASALSRVVGIAYMVVLPRIIYDDGMGLYQLVRPIHYFAAVIAIAGIPVAVSKLVAEKAANGSLHGVKRVFRIGLLVMTITGSLTAVTMIAGANFLADTVAQDSAVRLTIMLLGPACFFLALSAAFRGFFQGMQYMTPTAVAQITDQVARVVSTIILAILLIPRGIEYAVAGVALGSLIGEFMGWLVLVLFYFIQRPILFGQLESTSQLSTPNRRDQESRTSILKRVVSLAFPAVVATVLWPIMQLADTLLIPARMQTAGFEPDVIREAVGHLGMALTLAQFPNIVTVALATSLIPAISEAWALGSRRLVAHRSEEAIRVALLFGVPSFAGLYVLAVPISEMLFGYAQAAAPLRILASGAVTLGLIQSTTGILQGLGDMMVPVTNLTAGVILKFGLSYVLVANPELGMLGAAWSTTASWALIAVLNLASVFRRVGVVIHLKDSIIKPLISTGALAITVYYIQDTLHLFANNSVSTLTAIVVGFVFYFLLLMIGGTITRRDVTLIPGELGRKLSRILYEWGFLRK